MKVGWFKACLDHTFGMKSFENRFVVEITTIKKNTFNCLELDEQVGKYKGISNCKWMPFRKNGV